MKNYVKKPVVVEAYQFDGNIRSIDNFPISEVGKFKVSSENGQYYLIIPTLEGDMKAVAGDWIIKGVNGEFYPCKPDIFEKSYDLVEKGIMETLPKETGKKLTVGEKAVGIGFNPSLDDDVYFAKKLAADQIDLLEKIHSDRTDGGAAMGSWFSSVFRTQAFNLIIQAQMALVKYITWKD